MSIDAMKQALAALEQYTNVVTSVNDPNSWVSVSDGGKPARDAITALRAAIEQAQPNDFNPDWDAMAVMVEEQQRMAKRIAELEAQPEQEPVSMRLPKAGDRVICLEDDSLATVVSLTAGGSPDIVFSDGSRGTYLLREFAELFGYATPSTQQPRQWQGLTDEEIEELCWTEMDRRLLSFARAIEAKLKEKNA